MSLRVILSSAVALTLVVGAAGADGAVRRISLKSPVEVGATAAVTVSVTPRARCVIEPAPGSFVRGPGLRPRSGGRITWRWKVHPKASLGRSRVVVRCGASGTLRASFVITPAELSLTDAAKAACARVPARVLRRYRTQLIPLLERTIATLRDQYGTFDCAWGSNYYRDGGPISYYLVSVRRAAARCNFTVVTQVAWANEPPLPGYDGPVDERYTETCASLRSSG
jgi:hypothetical protein